MLPLLESYDWQPFGVHSAYWLQSATFGVGKQPSPVHSQAAALHGAVDRTLEGWEGVISVVGSEGGSARGGPIIALAVAVAATGGKGRPGDAGA